MNKPQQNERRTSNIERRIKRKKEWRETNNRMTNDEKNEWWSLHILEWGFRNADYKNLKAPQRS